MRSTRADIHDGQELTGSINRPDTDAQDQHFSKSSFSACNARPVHTDGSFATLQLPGWRGSYALHRDQTGSLPIRRKGPLSAARTRSKTSPPFRHLSTVKSVTDLPIGA